jgi:hypothetical protein
VSRKDLDEKLAEARRIIEYSDEVSPELGGAAFWLLGEVDRLRKIEDGLDALITMKKQVHGTISEQIKHEISQEYYYGTNGVIELRSKAAALKAEWEPLEALLSVE